MSKTITLTIDQNGDQIFLKTDGAEIFRALGITVTRRASHIVPDNVLLRGAFRTVRALVPDTSVIAQWSREWRCLWRVTVVNGPTLPGRWRDRKQAIEAEVEFLNGWFLDGIQQP